MSVLLQMKLENSLFGNKVVIFAIGLFFISLSLNAKSKISPTIAQQVCPQRVELFANEKINFSSLEKTFLCGDPASEAWKDIPLNQAKFHIETFLESRGYYKPVFKEDGDILRVFIGEPAYLTQVALSGAPEFLDIRKRRKTLGQRLTPKFLDTLEAWVLFQLKASGYPCPQVRSKANVETGHLIIEVQAGPLQNVESITEEIVPKLGGGVLRRFDAFEFDKPYNQKLLDLTATRMQNEGILQNAYFTATCGETGAEVEQHSFAGKPRLLRIGAGVDTDQYFILKASWKHTRLGQKGSNVSADLSASYKLQELILSNSLYLFAPTSRWHFLPQVSFLHDREFDFHYISANASFNMARTWDTQSYGMSFSAGPNLNYVNTFRGAEPGLTRFVSLQYNYQWMSHNFEYYKNSPRSGYNLEAKGNLNSKTLLSDISAQQIQIKGQYLHNFFDYDPPLFVLGVRGGVNATFLQGGEGARSKLPPNYRYYLGGSSTLRGFSLQELPGDDDGALSSIFMGLEFRLANYLPFGIEPYVFVDAGLLGGNNFRLNMPLYYSPGLGIRYASPFGVFKTSIAHGFKAGGSNDNVDNHFQFLFSFGEEF